MGRRNKNNVKSEQTPQQKDFFLDDEILGKAYDHRLMKRLLKFTKPYRPQLLICVLISLLLSLTGLYRPYLSKMAIDNYISPRNMNGFVSIIILFICLIITEITLRFVYSYISGEVGQNVMFDLRIRLYNHIMKLSIDFFDHNPIGRLITRLSSDVEVLNTMLSSSIIEIIGDIFVLTGTIIVMLFLNWRLACISFLVMPFIFLASWMFKNRSRQAYRKERSTMARINAFLQEHVTGMGTVQAFNAQERTFDKFTIINQDHFSAVMNTLYTHAIFKPTVGLISSVSTALIIWYGGGEVIQKTLTIGLLVAFIEYVHRFFGPLQDLADQYNTMQNAMASSERLFNLLDTENTIPDPTEPKDLPERSLDIEFRDVWFSYSGDDNWILKGISFHVPAGNTFAIVGHTGAGKTTIISLILRFYDPQRGQILVGGIDIRNIDKSNLRKRMSLVLQDVFLFATDLTENIRLNNPKIDDEQVQISASHVRANEFISKLENGYKTEVGERGCKLSSGQRQLIAFARALAYQPDILILDEATSNVDTETETLIQEALDILMQNRTALIIAHRLSTIKKVNKIILLHKGTIREQGTHFELIEKDGLYSKLYKLQYQ